MDGGRSGWRDKQKELTKCTDEWTDREVETGKVTDEQGERLTDVPTEKLMNGQTDTLTGWMGRQRRGTDE